MAPKKNEKGKKKGTEKGPSFTADMLVEQGNVALSNMEPELAEKFFSRALTMAPLDTNIMDALADVQIQIGEPEKAIQLLLQSTSVAPNENPFKWFFLGQLQVETESVKSYRTGIQLLTELLAAESEVDTRRVLEKQIAKAHCSITEIYLTDLCYEEDAEATCESEVTAALTVCPDSLDGLQTRASLRLSQKRKADASQLISQVFDRVMHIRRVVSARTVVEEMSGAAEPQEFQDLPELEFTIATVKLLIECAGADPALYVKALDLGSDLLEEDDENVELWYLMGVASLGGLSPVGACGSDDAPSDAASATVDFAGAQYHFSHALGMLNRLREEAAEQGEPNAQFLYQEQYDLVQQHLRLIAAQASETAGAQVGGSAPVDEEWGDDDEAESSDMVVDK